MLRSTTSARALHALRVYDLKPMLKRATVVAWHKHPGDIIQQDDKIVTLHDRMTHRDVHLRHRDSKSYFMAKQIFALNESIELEQALGVIADTREEVEDARNWDPRHDYIASPIELDSVWGAEVGPRNSWSLLDELAREHNKAKAAYKHGGADNDKKKSAKKDDDDDEKDIDAVLEDLRAEKLKLETQLRDATMVAPGAPYQQKDHVFPSEAAMEKAMREHSDVDRGLHWGGELHASKLTKYPRSLDDDELDDDQHMHMAGYQFQLNRDAKTQKVAADRDAATSRAQAQDREDAKKTKNAGKGKKHSK